MLKCLCCILSFLLTSSFINIQHGVILLHSNDSTTAIFLNKFHVLGRETCHLMSIALQWMCILVHFYENTSFNLYKGPKFVCQIGQFSYSFPKATLFYWWMDCDGMSRTLILFFFLNGQLCCHIQERLSICGCWTQFSRNKSQRNRFHQFVHSVSHQDWQRE